MLIIVELLFDGVLFIRSTKALKNLVCLGLENAFFANCQLSIANCPIFFAVLPSFLSFVLKLCRKNKDA